MQCSHVFPNSAVRVTSASKNYKPPACQAGGFKTFVHEPVDELRHCTLQVSRQSAHKIEILSVNESQRNSINMLSESDGIHLNFVFFNTIARQECQYWLILLYHGSNFVTFKFRKKIKVTTAKLGSRYDDSWEQTFADCKEKLCHCKQKDKR